VSLKISYIACVTSLNRDKNALKEEGALEVITFTLCMMRLPTSLKNTVVELVTHKHKNARLKQFTVVWTRSRSFCSEILCDKFEFLQERRCISADEAPSQPRSNLQQKPQINTC